MQQHWLGAPLASQTQAVVDTPALQSFQGFREAQDDRVSSWGYNLVISVPATVGAWLLLEE